MSQYDSFITYAFTQHQIPASLLHRVRSWVLSEMPCEDGDCSRIHSAHRDLGYAELGDITVLTEAMAQLNNCIVMNTLHDTDRKTQQARAQYIQDAGGREGKGFYRYALKAYYLYHMDLLK